MNKRFLISALLLSACQSATMETTGADHLSAPQTDRRPVFAPSTVLPEADPLVKMAEHLAAEYESGRRDFPAMSTDPRESVSPATLAMLTQLAERLAAREESRHVH